MRISKASQMRDNIVCADGFKISYQAGEGYYCEPKVNEWDDNFVSIMNQDRTEEEMNLIRGNLKTELLPAGTVEYDSVECLMRDYDEVLEEYMAPYHCSCSKCPGGHKGDMSEPFMLPAHVAIFILIKHGGAVQGHIPPFPTNSHGRAVQMWKDWKDEESDGIRTVDYTIAVSWYGVKAVEEEINDTRITKKGWIVQDDKGHWHDVDGDGKRVDMEGNPIFRKTDNK